MTLLSSFPIRLPRRTFFLAIPAAVLFLGLPIDQAAAADMVRPSPVYTKAAPPVAAGDWSGFYIGAHVGKGTTDPVAYVNPAALIPLIGGIDAATAVASPPFSLSVAPQGGLAGLQLGRNWQVGQIVFGVEADASFAAMRASSTGYYRIIAMTGFHDGWIGRDGQVTLSQKINALGSVRGRVGMAFGSLFAYGTAGLGWAHVTTSLASAHTAVAGIGFVPGPTPASALDGSASDSGTKFGYAAGGGAEWAFAPNWSVKGEYLYYGLGDVPALSIPGTTMPSSPLHIHTGKLGLNYRFMP